MSELLVKLGNSGSEISVRVYGDNAMNKTAVYKWVTRFSEGRESVTTFVLNISFHKITGK
jgi:hypothetical protein